MLKFRKSCISKKVHPMTMPFSPCTNQGSGATVCDDRSVQMLNHIFGDVVNKLALNGDIEGVTQTNSILASMFGVFNSAVLVVGSLIITYIAIVGVLSTANDGEVLGKKWSTMWVPVRLAFSVLMLLPTTTGYSMIQLFVLMIALWGAGAANNTYKAGIGTGLFNNVYGRNGSYVTAGQQDYAERMNQIQKQKEAYYKQQGIAPGVPTEKGAYGDPENTGVGYNAVLSELGNHDVPQGWIQTPRLTPHRIPTPVHL